MDTGQIVAYILGVGTDKQDDLLSKQEQEVIRDPEKRNETQLKRAAERGTILDDLLEPRGRAQAVIKYALRFEGRTESPAGSKPAIVADAKARPNGCAGWYSVSQAHPGDFALFNWPGGEFVDHVEIDDQKPRRRTWVMVLLGDGVREAGSTA